MRTLQATDDLVVEVWPGGEGGHPLVKVRSLALERDGEAVGVVVVWPEEMDGLIAALVEARAELERDG